MLLNQSVCPSSATQWSHNTSVSTSTMSHTGKPLVCNWVCMYLTWKRCWFLLKVEDISIPGHLHWISIYAVKKWSVHQKGQIFWYEMQNWATSVMKWAKAVWRGAGFSVYISLPSGDWYSETLMVWCANFCFERSNGFSSHLKLWNSTVNNRPLFGHTVLNPPISSNSIEIPF